MERAMVGAALHKVNEKLGLEAENSAYQRTRRYADFTDRRA